MSAVTTTTETTTEPNERSDRPDGAGLHLTETEALLAVLIDHLTDEVSALRYALGATMQRIGWTGDEGMEWSYEKLYPQWFEVDGLPRVRQAAAPPFPTHWLRMMATSGRSLAQVAGSKVAAAERIERALTDPRG